MSRMNDFRAQCTHVAARRRLDKWELRKYLVDADPALLVLSLVHVTGDAGLLDRFGALLRYEQGHTDDMLGNAPPAQIDSQSREALIDIAVGALDRAVSEQSEYLTGDQIGDELFMQMCKLAVDRSIGAEYVPMFKEQSGFVPDLLEVPDNKGRDPRRIDLAIIGAGIGGLTAAIQAQERGFRYTIFEKTGGIGGAWNIHRYPGVGVDTPSMFYSMSFELNPQWTNHYPSGAEYHQYLNKVAEKYGLDEHIQFHTEVLRLRWDDEAQEWELTCIQNGKPVETVRATAVFHAVGGFPRPMIPPDLYGLHTFAGQWMHSMEWNPDVDLTGKRVAVIGTGSTSAQLVPSIAGRVKHLTVFQRQPAWYKPNTVGDGVISEGVRWCREHLPYYVHWNRLKDYYPHSDYTGYPVVRVDPQWAREHVSTSPANDRLMQMCLENLHRYFPPGSEMAAKLTPHFPPMAKRIVRDTPTGSFYKTLTLPHVALETGRIARIAAEGIVTFDGRVVEVDVILFATGMQVMYLSQFDVIGRDGIRLADMWGSGGARAYLNEIVPNFPNLFISHGPNGGGGHGGGQNFMIELESHVAMECLQLLVDEGANSIEVTNEAYEEWNRSVDERMAGAIWTWDHKAHTYYRLASGRPVGPTPFLHRESWDWTRKPNRDHFIVR
jgi:4-hydroxyacetophenone monooxygenase